jgi:WD40 repeat protein
MWDRDASGQEGTLLPGQSDWKPAVLGLSDSGQWLVAAGTDRSIRVWDMLDPEASPRSIPASPRPDDVRAVAIDAEGERAAALMNDGALVLWATGTTPLPDILLGHENVGLSMRFSADGSTLVTGAGDGARVWDLRAPEEPMVLRGHSLLVYAVAYSPDGTRLASGGRDGTILLWNPGDLQQPPTRLASTDGWVTALAFSPDNRTLAAGTSTGTVSIWSLDDPGREPETLRGDEMITSIAFHPDGQRLAVTANAGIVVWDLASASIDITLAFPGQRVQSVAFAPDGGSLAAGGCLEAGDQEGVCDLGGIALWSLETDGEPPVTREHPGDMVMAIAFAPNGQWLAAAGKDGGVDMWDPGDFSADSVRFSGPGAASLAFNPTSEELAVGHWNGTISVWRIDRPGTPSLISAHRGYVYALAWAPDGQTLAATGSDGTVQLWRSTEALKDEICGRVGRNLTPREWDLFIGGSVDYEATCPDLPPGTDTPP